MATQVQRGDVVVLSDAAVQSVAGNHALWNEDLRPCTRAEHAWPGMKFASLWIGMCICLPTYSMASGFIALGMNWWESVLTVLVGSCIVLIPILLMSHAGTKFGIPYPVFARLWFGKRGAHIPALARAVIAAGWFGINSWLGGQALDAILGRVISHWGSFSFHMGLSFLIFWAINVLIAMRGPQAIGKLAMFAAPTLAVGAIALLIWAAAHAGGFGEMLSAPAAIHGAKFWAAFYPSVIGVIAFWATMALNIPDYTRYAATQRGQVLGQIFAMPITMALFSFIGIAVTSATVILYHQAMWDPVDLIAKFPTVMVIVAGIVVILSSVTINVGANVMAPARAFENLWPRRITFAVGAVITGLLAFGMQPWYVLSEFSNYIYNWLGTYGTLLGPFDGIAIADYWLVRSRQLDLLHLYAASGRYDYARGFNLRAVGALVIGWVIALLGLVVPGLKFLWSGGWLFSLLGGMVAYWWLMKGHESILTDTEYQDITLLEPAAGSVTYAPEAAVTK
ncbi:NCS1 family nucleobase:cation symporter-1 [Alicyclobacillus cycloheptanicus]|uniref:NCS1 family nucleobase:cation symporter-1 n=1 Tax=Alicyclobacillus cycloheptanicus TaxID=1457 RepID=A0ABT9XEE9_9BACL|nr:NCS1 family nucleobase:cation symporter-1 [Alicyclobacillus cycloheptanicus]MDQ0188676.1 NCS1 family nucleobase:cation symporter-1 [Alicyclobacillus cycloheptanicus]WDM00652.1 NCS1 family nucleobase:cation symporter-1 [Alicyclobacillus cycloheptanicus]